LNMDCQGTGWCTPQSPRWQPCSAQTKPCHSPYQSSAHPHGWWTSLYPTPFVYTCMATGHGAENGKSRKLVLAHNQNPQRDI